MKKALARHSMAQDLKIALEVLNRFVSLFIVLLKEQ